MWKQLDGSLPELVDLYRELLEVQVEARGKIACPCPNPISNPQEIAKKLRMGTPLLLFDDIPWDWKLLGEVLHVVAEVIQRHSSDDLIEAAEPDGMVVEDSLLKRRHQAQ